MEGVSGYARSEGGHIAYRAAGEGTDILRIAGNLIAVGLLDEEPEVRVSGAQAVGCAPVATAFAEGTDAIRPVKPDTIAKSLAIGNPADGPYALDVVRRTGGAIADVSDAASNSGEARRWCAMRRALFGPMPGSLSRAATRRSNAGRDAT